MTTTAHHARRPARERRPITAPTTASVPRSADALAIDLDLAVSSAAAHTAEAERELHVSELARRRSAQALEQDLRPMRLDETARAALRAAYAEADAEVARRRRTFDQAARLEAAAREIVAAMSASVETDARTAADGAGGVLIAWSRLRDAVGGPRIATA